MENFQKERKIKNKHSTKREVLIRLPVCRQIPYSSDLFSNRSE